VELEAEPALGAERLDDRGRRLLLDLGVPVAGERPDERSARLEVELGDEVGLAEVEVDGAGMDGGVRAQIGRASCRERV